ncbi:hypothetical protein HID58_060322, partial [Brassica napus]
SEHSLWLPRFWDSMNFKKDMEFVGITVLFLDEKMWLDKYVMSRALASPKKQLESLSVSSLILPQTGVPGIRHSTFESLRVGRSNVVGKIRYVQGSDLSKETTQVVIRLLIDS